LKKITCLLVAMLLLIPAISCFAVAPEGEGDKQRDWFESPYTEEGADELAALNLFRAAFPDTEPGGEEYHLELAWSADPEHGYLGVPKEVCSAKLNAFMTKYGMEQGADQWKIYDYQNAFVFCKGEKGNGAKTEIPPVDNPREVVRNTSRDTIIDLWNQGIWQVNVKRINTPGWTSSFYFLPPDFQVTKVELEGEMATATFYNGSPLIGTTVLRLYQVAQNGTVTLLKEQPFTFGPFGTAKLSARYSSASNPKYIAATVARPYSNDRSTWQDIYVCNEHGLEFGLKGEAIEYGNGAYPPETLNILKGSGDPTKDRWANNIKQVQVEAPCTDISVTSLTRNNGRYMVGDSARLTAIIRRANDGPAGAVNVKVTLSGSSAVRTLSLRRNESKPAYFGITATKEGCVNYTVTAMPQGIPDCTPGNNSKNLRVCTDRMPALGNTDEEVHVGIIDINRR